MYASLDWSLASVSVKNGGGDAARRGVGLTKVEEGVCPLRLIPKWWARLARWWCWAALGLLLGCDDLTGTSLFLLSFLFFCYLLFEFKFELCSVLPFLAYLNSTKI
jgi:hypothetical protein